MVGVAVKVTEAPAHMVVELAATLTLTGRLGFTVIVIPPLVAVKGDAQVALDVSTTVTIFVFARVVVV